MRTSLARNFSRLVWTIASLSALALVLVLRQTYHPAAQPSSVDASVLRAAAERQREHHHNVSRTIRELLKDARKEREGLEDDKFTIMMPSFGRPLVLKANLERIATGAVPSLKEVVVLWGSPRDQGRLIDVYVSGSGDWVVPVKFVSLPCRDLNSRFHPELDVKTRCILSADDDIKISPAALEFGFQAWRMTTAPIVGYVPRRHYRDKHGDWAYDFSRFNSNLPYSMILTDMAFVDVALLDVYNSDIVSDQRKLVKDLLNCEDILLNFVGSIAYGQPPLLVQPPGPDLYHFAALGQQTGISRTLGHKEKRHLCMRRFREAFGDDALIMHSMTMSYQVKPKRLLEGTKVSEREIECGFFPMRRCGSRG